MSRILSAVLDVVMIVVFATIGRSSHGGAEGAAQVLGVAAPFLVGAALGWLALGFRGWRRTASIGAGAVVLAGTVVIGLGYRIAIGAWAPSFLVVATLSLAVLLLGWRVLAAVVGRFARTRTVG